MATLKDFRENYFKNFATSKIKFKLRQNMPWFDHFRFDWNGQTLTTNQTTHVLELRPGKNTIKVAGVNQYGRVGPQTVLEIMFDDCYPEQRLGSSVLNEGKRKNRMADIEP